MPITDQRDKIKELLGTDLVGDIEAAMWMADTCAEEVAKAQAEHPDAADLIWHGYSLCGPTTTLMHENRELYRGHCRELLARLAAGEDTRPGTSAEGCCVFMETSLLAPMHGAAVTVYGRMFCDVFPAQGADIWRDQLDRWGDDYEVREIDREVRRKLAQAKRKLGKRGTCDGMHDGEAVECRFR